MLNIDWKLLIEFFITANILLWFVFWIMRWSYQKDNKIKPNVKVPIILPKVTLFKNKLKDADEARERTEKRNELG